MSEQYTYAVGAHTSPGSRTVFEQHHRSADRLPGLRQCLQFLEEKGWGDSESSGDAEAILTREEEKIWEVVKDLHIDMDHFAVLSYPKLFHNLKAAIKEVCTGEKNRHIYYEDVSIPARCDARDRFWRKISENFLRICSMRQQKPMSRFFIPGTDSCAIVSLTVRRLTPSMKPGKNRMPRSFVIMRNPR